MKIPFRILSRLQNLLLFILFAALPSIESSSLMYGVLSAKSFLFIAGASLLFLLSLSRMIFQKKTAFRFHGIDCLLLLYLGYIVLRNSLAELSCSLLFLELTGLSLLFLILRTSGNGIAKPALTGLMLGGLIQAIHGGLQLWEVFPSHHELFKITGSFLNPGPFAGFLAAVFPIALGLYLFDPFRNPKKKTPVLKGRMGKAETFLQTKAMSYLSLLTVVLTALIILGSHSRAALLALLISSLYLLLLRYRSRLRFFFSSKLRKAAILLFIAVFCGMITFLYQLNKESVHGRWLIWKTAAQIIKDRPFTGQGYDGFKHCYLNYQVAYFRNHPENAETMLAGDSN